MRNRIVFLASILSAGVLSGCQTEPTRDPEFATVPPRPMAAPRPTHGAIYQAGYSAHLFEDLRARRVGDVLTIHLVEKTNASKKAATKVDKDNSATVTNPTLLGSAVQFNTPPFIPLASNVNNSLQTTLSAEREFDGSGESSQSNSLSGDISVTVAQVLANGNLVVQGEKILTLNQGNEHLRFSGIVRQADIGSDNSVNSNLVANARIIYAGQGAVADSNSMGWLARFFSSEFFPF